MISEKLKEYHKNYYLKNREALIAKSKEWNKLNRKYKPISNLKIKKQRLSLILKKNEERVKQFKEQLNKTQQDNILG